MKHPYKEVGDTINHDNIKRTKHFLTSIKGMNSA